MLLEYDIRQIDGVFDRLYGSIEFTEGERRLLQTSELRRLRHVSLSAVPSWLLPAGTCATRLEHSIGTGHLAKLVGKLPDFQQDAPNLISAAIGHDVGTPPFSHISEFFMVKVLGKTHEEFVEEIVNGSEFARAAERIGASMERVTALIKGETFPALINAGGSLDVDNLDNALRFGLSIGILDRPLYSPEQIAVSYAIRDGKLVLNARCKKHLEEWATTREKVYSFVYSHYNLSLAAMLFRALDFAYRRGELTREYFVMTDAQALHHLERRCNRRTQVLTERLERSDFYPRVFNFATTSPSEEVARLCADPFNREVLADEISALLRTNPVDICIYLGRNRGYKRIDFPLTDEQNGEESYRSKGQLTFMAQVYVHSRVLGHCTQIREFMKERLGVRAQELAS